MDQLDDAYFELGSLSPVRMGASGRYCAAVRGARQSCNEHSATECARQRARTRSEPVLSPLWTDTDPLREFRQMWGECFGRGDVGLSLSGLSLT